MHNPTAVCGAPLGKRKTRWRDAMALFRDQASGLYFADYNEQLVLQEVIVGPLSSITKQDLHDALGTTTNVAFTKGRLAFNSFQVVADKRGFRAIR